MSCCVVVRGRPGLRVDDDHRRPLLAVQRRDLASRSASGRGSSRIVAGESPSMYCRDGFGTSVASDCTWSTRGSCFIRSWSARTPSSTFGVQIPPLRGRLDDDEDRRQLALPEVLPDEVDRLPRLGGGRAARPPSRRAPCSHAGRGHHQREHRERDPDAGHGERITRAIVVCQPVPLPAGSRAVARRFQRSRCRCSSTSTTGRSRRPVTIAVAGDDRDRDGDRADHHHREQAEHAPSSARA